MCLIVFAWVPDSAQPLLMLANRDEMHARATAPLAQWSDYPQIYAGRDLLAGGSWLGVAPQGRFAALTNIRALEGVLPRSRGELVSNYLAGHEPPAAYMHRVAQQAAQFNGFNLLVGDSRQLWFFNSKSARPQRLSAGIYALSNASLDTPWPKLVRIRSLFSQNLNSTDDDLFNLMRDRERPSEEFLPETGVGLVLERMLSSIFIQGEYYGTRATSLLRMTQTNLSLKEQSYTVAGAVQELKEIVLAAD
ncbi:NRDE family protein [Thiopseudomonas acetoxidans]|uniref:NRDE family protein n=1 Tax=Thiopseudomonas acetoxidans TaxID=3041622 RepID=A0ABT7SRA7_9GAMM|nr:NRDE family protein [Thiopseudomonas sp. CY1220]MDM7858696.1 NRDE family protein [Thiopseudomonas sp. CY1220]